ncbi:protein adenylyltransferase SelO [Diaphorobacter caeni]|uniref:protein adenylyltransferase SelO n=1 Tax=Diaphorobacter caeni TaxID=2784387 RepID=UPI00188F5DA1|nr:YdiU family protein [Diaphorobacter caeni]MBF5004731.1 YdiU family protein [Diaphorobacter caeni]
MTPETATSSTSQSLFKTADFAGLGTQFFTALQPTPLPDPHWVARNPAVARLAGIDPQWLETDEALQVLVGNAVLPGTQPIATVYSGHQFGVWAGQLGDGRAILLGETDNGEEIQLKGAGRTPYSRMGDGRAVLRSSIREYLCSEAMHGLGIPTTRAMALIGSPAPVYREQPETAAVVTRVSPSFIRFGHFEHFSSRKDTHSLRQLADHVIDHFYPECRTGGAFDNNAYANLLQTVSERTAVLLAQWQAVGFCHGVMNTDNMSILGLTIDYGPFQFLDAYVPGHICNHSDSQGRYAFDQQPSVAYWNLLCLAQALLQLVGEVETARAAVASYPEVFGHEFKLRMAAKLGLPAAATRSPEFVELLQSLLNLMAQDAVDYTIFWRRLSLVANRQADNETLRDIVLQREVLDAWLVRWRELLATHGDPKAQADMLTVNPRFVLRNHVGEIAIRAATQGDFSTVNTLQDILTSPFDEHPGQDSFADFPPDWASHISISCSS